MRSTNPAATIEPEDPGPEDSMLSRFRKCSRAAARAIAIFGAALLLISQTVGVAHFHENAGVRDGIVAAQPVTDSGLCPVCQLAMHSPVSVASALTVARGPAIAETVFVDTPVRFDSPVFSDARVRAPPTAL
jgi:hypothetical protein